MPTLDQIMFHTKEPQRTKAIERFLESEDTVKLKASNGASLVVMHRGKKETIPPAGKWYSRRAAIDLLFDHGEKGIYTGKDRNTMMTQSSLDSMKKEDREYWVGDRGVKIQTVYATHVPTDPDGTEEDALPTHDDDGSEIIY